MKNLIFVCLALTLGSAEACYNNTDVEGKKNWFYTAVEYVFNGCEKVDVVQDSTDVVSAVSRILETKKIGLNVAIVPIKARIYQENLPDAVKLSEITLDRYKNLKDTLLKNKVNVIDLNSEFTQAKKKYSDFPLFYRTDHHWSSQGSDLAAQIISKKIIADGLIVNLPTVQWEVKKDTVRLTSYSNLGSIQIPESKHELYIPTYYSKMGNGSEGLLDGNYPGIVVTGDSFANGDHDTDGRAPFSTAIGFYTKRDVLNAAIPGKGPFYPFLDYVSSSAYQNHLPKTVVWEMWEALLQTYDSGFAYTGRFEDNFYLDMAAGILSCPESGTAVKDSLVANFDQYLHFSLLPNTKNIKIRITTKAGAHEYNLTDASDEGNTYNVPLADIGNNQISAISIKSGEKPVSPTAIKLCTLPKSASDEATINNKYINFVQRNYPVQLKFTGFYSVPEESSSRWALNEQSTLQFYSGKAGLASLSVSGSSYYADQSISLSNNGKSIGKFDTKNDNNFNFVVKFPVVKGKNLIMMSYLKNNKTDPVRNVELLKSDPRPFTLKLTNFTLAMP